MAKQRLKPKLTREEMNNQYLNSIFEEFMAEKKALGREPDTLKAYQVTFNEFYKYFGERAEETGNIVASMFIEWTNSMKDRGLRPATINHHLMGMRTFMYWCMDEERQYIDRFKIRLVRVQDEMPKDYTLEEVKRNKRETTPGRRKSAARSPCYSKVNVPAAGDKRIQQTRNRFF